MADGWPHFLQTSFHKYFSSELCLKGIERQWIWDYGPWKVSGKLNLCLHLQTELHILKLISVVWASPQMERRNLTRRTLRETTQFLSLKCGHAVLAGRARVFSENALVYSSRQKWQVSAAAALHKAQSNKLIEKHLSWKNDSLEEKGGEKRKEGRRKKWVSTKYLILSNKTFWNTFQKYTCGKMSNLEIELDNLIYEITRYQIVKEGLTN